MKTLKTTTVQTALNRLEKLADNKEVSRNSLEYKEVMNFIIKKGKENIRPVVSYGSRRNITYKDFSYESCMLLTKLGIDYGTGNDAPRGGQLGDYICLSTTKIK